jgi:hypothetical protein
MHVPFSELPGRHERHLRRKLGNPLFPTPVSESAEQALLETQRRDHEELVGFLAGLRELVRRAVDLRPTEDSQVILDLKSSLDEAYERASGLAGDQSGNRDAIRTLIASIMSTIRVTSAGDPMAERQLEEEDEARRLHLRLLEHPLVADLLDPDSLIGPDELAATLLTESDDAVQAALELFDVDQLRLLCRDARGLLDGLAELPSGLGGAPRRLGMIVARLDLLVGDRQRRDTGSN